jgi:hypothetical protein
VPLIAQSLIDRYAAGPSATRISAVQRLHQRVRSVLGDASYETFLQGSYRNGTAIADSNDVDIMALSRGRGSPQYDFQWDELFGAIERALRSSYQITGRVSRGDKCITISGTPSADVVPALRKGAITSDPIAIYSFRERTERDNYPRLHYARGVDKNKPLRTHGAYKPTVRLFKRWGAPVQRSREDGAELLHRVRRSQRHRLEVRHVFAAELRGGGPGDLFWSRSKIITSVAGDKDVLVAADWHPDRFEAFQRKLLTDLGFVVRALNATTASDANRLWRLAFGDTT